MPPASLVLCREGAHRVGQTHIRCVKSHASRSVRGRRGDFHRYLSEVLRTSRNSRIGLTSICRSRRSLPAPGCSTYSGKMRIGSDSSRARYRRRSRSALLSTKTSIEEHKELLSPLIAFFERRGRAPGDDELPEGDAIRKRFGSLRGALRLVQRGHDPEVWKRIIITRAQDLLLFLALSRFDGRPRFGQLPMGVRRDIKSIFSSYRNACEEADVALLAVGDMNRVRKAAQRSSIGKITPSAIYVHESALDRLSPLLRLYEGCARRYIGRVEEGNIIKLHVLEPMVSYLTYPKFESDPHPALAQALTVHLQTFRLRQRDYRTSRNPPILHRKEAFLAEDHALHAKFSRLTQQEESKGLFENSSRIGTQFGWEERLRERGVTLKGHRVVQIPENRDLDVS